MFASDKSIGIKENYTWEILDTMSLGVTLTPEESVV